MSDSVHEARAETGRGATAALWRRLFRYLWREPRQVRVLVACAALTALCESGFPLITGRLIDDYAADGAVRVAPYLAAYAALLLAMVASVWTFIDRAGHVRARIAHDVRRDAFANLQRLSFSFYDRRPVGWLMARMTSDCDRLAVIFAWGVLDTVWCVVVMAATATVMFWLDAGLAAVVLAVVPVAAVVSLVFQRRILRTAREVRRRNSIVTGAFNEGLAGVRTAKSFACEPALVRDFRGLTGDLYRASVRNALASAVYLPVVLTLASVAIGLALAAGGVKHVGGGVTLGTLVIFMTYARAFFEPVQEIARWFAEFQMAHASAERVVGLIEAVPEVRDSDAVRARVAARGGDAADDGGRARIERVRFDGVGFRYGDGPWVLRGLDLEIPAGTSVALVGETGGGKTTLASLLCRFYEPVEGRVLFDGRDYRERSLAWLQRKLGIVQQEPHLFSGSVADNVRYGRLDATDGEVRDALERVGAGPMLAALGQGADTEVGEGGDRLSTGQKQLVSFARAILADPEILVLDEATSSIDAETEETIRRGMAAVLSGRTSVVIAHRLATVRAADRILVVDAGRIVEDGPHADLVAAGGRYADLVREQTLHEIGLDADAWHEEAPVA